MIQLHDWLDRHHVAIVRTHATNLDGAILGKYIHRDKFVKSLPLGPAISDMSLAVDLGGDPYLGFWHPFRQPNLGDIHLRPDLSSLIYDGTDPDLGHCAVDFVGPEGEEIGICPRTKLRQVCQQLQGEGLSARVAVELEFFVYEESFRKARKKRYRKLSPRGTNRAPLTYAVRNSYHHTAFMREVIARLEWQHMRWESWNDEAAPGQIELNLEPTDPVTAADHTIRIKNILYEVASDMGLSLTFMPKPQAGYGSGMHIHHSITRRDKAVFFDAEAPGGRSTLMNQWLAGIMQTLPGAVSILCPSINSYRRMVDFGVCPTTRTWGVDNKTAAVRVIGGDEKSARIEHRVGSADLNPYLGMAVILAGGLCGLRHRLSPPPEFTGMAWALPGEEIQLPRTITDAADCLAADTLLAEVLSQDFIDYWINTRRWEWLMYNASPHREKPGRTTAWELQRYFEFV